MLNWKDFPRKCQFPFLLACAVFPAAVVMVHSFAPSMLDKLWYFPAAYVLLAQLCLVLKGKIRLIAGIAGAAAQIVLGVRTLPLQESVGTMLIPLLYAIVLLQGLRMGGWSRETEMHPTWLAIGLVLHIFGQIMVNVARRTGDKPVYIACAPALMAAFILFILLFLLSMNRGAMNGASMGRQRVPQRMKRRNTIFTVLLLCAALFFASLPEIVRAVDTAWQWFLHAILAFIRWLSQFMPQSSPGGSGNGGPGDLGGLGEAGEPSLLAVIMEKIMLVIAVLALAALTVFVAYKLYRKLKLLLKYLAQRLSLFAQSSTEDFEDEITDTRDEGEQERTGMLESLLRRFQRVDERKLSPTERIRYRYLRLLLRHPEWRSSQTARETIPEEAAALYERARYSGEAASQSDAEDFASRIKAL